MECGVSVLVPIPVILEGGLRFLKCILCSLCCNNQTCSVDSSPEICRRTCLSLVDVWRELWGGLRTGGSSAGSYRFFLAGKIVCFKVFPHPSFCIQKNPWESHDTNILQQSKALIRCWVFRADVTLHYLHHSLKTLCELKYCDRIGGIQQTQPLNYVVYRRCWTSE